MGTRRNAVTVRAPGRCMRIRLISIVAGVAALAIGVTASQASLTGGTNVKVKLAKAGAPAQVTVAIDNTDKVNVPRRISSVLVTSKDAKWNSKAVPFCKKSVPTNAAGTNTGAALKCPKNSKVGQGKFSVNIGTPGQPIPTDLGVINGVINVYNYKPQGGEQAALLLEEITDRPIPDTHIYIRAGISKSGVFTAIVPNTGDLPPNVSNLLRNPDLSYRTTALASVTVTLSSPRAKRGKRPFLTLKSLKNIDVSVVLNREDAG